MRVRLPFDRLIKPSNIAMLAVGMSFAAWVFPSFGMLRKGFDAPESLDPTSILVLLAWYLLIFFSFVLGQRFSTTFLQKIRPDSNAVSIESRPLYYIFTILAVMGMVTLIVKIFSSFSISQMLVVIALNQLNALRLAPYDETYSVGIISLRYLVIYSTSLAIYMLVKHRRYTPIHIFNVIFFVITLPILSRLILIATGVVTALLLLAGSKSFKIKFVKLGVFVGLAFLVLSVLNYSRNAKFYQERHLSFAAAGFAEIITYLGAPFQVSVGSSKILETIVTSPADTYRSYIDVGIELNTNSAFVLLHEQMGYFSWPYICCQCFFMGMVYSWLFSFGRTMFLLPCGAILYASAEMWRLDLFQAGIFQVWVIMGIGVPLFWLGFQKLLRSLRAAFLVKEADKYKSIDGLHEQPLL